MLSARRISAAASDSLLCALFVKTIKHVGSDWMLGSFAHPT
jgi:hypothetical protein